MLRQARLRALLVAVLSLGFARVSLAQRELHWDNFEVTAHLDADGRLHVTETQRMVFTGDWNGGERTFNIRPRQKLSLVRISRHTEGGWQELSLNRALSHVDDYAWSSDRTLRWRSRLTSDSPFAQTVIPYELQYVLSGILIKDGDQYLLDHDFAFPDRAGPINRFSLRLTLDPAWQPLSNVQDVYTAGPLPPGRSFVLRVPLRYAGAGVPDALDDTRPAEVEFAVVLLAAFTTIAILWFFVRERSLGRFAPISIASIDEVWLREHILTHPAELIGAAWDDSIGTPEVVSLIARMVSEGKLESEVAQSGRHKTSMALRLKVDRATLQGHERTLVDGLFFDGRTETTTEDVKAHYRTGGFNPAEAIKPELESSVRQMLPAGDVPRSFAFVNYVLFFAGVALMVAAWLLGQTAASAFFVAVGALIAAAIGWGFASWFRTQIHWGPAAALLCLIPAVAAAAGTAVFLWVYVGGGAVELEPLMFGSFVALSLWVTNVSVNGLKSRQSRAAIAFRKTLAAARQFFISELRNDRPALRDEWYPWVLAFGLGRQADDWSARSGSTSAYSDRVSTDSTHSTASSERWSGFGGGRSGGAGGGASWAAAATGMAAGVSAASSSGGSSGGGASSGGGSSGGGGGGGW